MGRWYSKVIEYDMNSDEENMPSTDNEDNSDLDTDEYWYSLFRFIYVENPRLIEIKSHFL